MPQDTLVPQPAAMNNAEPRKKRAKIMSACGECRRKKTKCNGEQPCRNCQKSNATCVYPASSQMDDKRNNGGPSKAALEAIEDRLKAIEDMLRTILQSQLPVQNLDPVAVNNFLNKSNTNRLPSIHNLSASLSTSPNIAYHHGTLVSPSTPNVNQLPPPIGLIQHTENESYHHHQHQHHHQYQVSPPNAYYEDGPSPSHQHQEQQNESQPMKKRKR